MNVAFESVGTALIIGFLGRLDSANSAAVEAELLAHLGDGQHGVVLDLSRLDYISSAGLRIVLIVAKRLKQVGRPMALFGLQPNIKDVFEISGFLNILDVKLTRAEALLAVE